MPDGDGGRRGHGGRAAAAVAALLVAVAATAIPAVPVVGQEQEGAEPVDLATVVPVETPGIDPVLDAVEVVETAATRRADEDVKAAAEEQGKAVLTWIQAEQTRQQRADHNGSAEQQVAAARAGLATAQAEQSAAVVELKRRQVVQADLRARLAVEQRTLRAAAAAAFTATRTDMYAFLGSLDDLSAAERQDATRERGIALQVARVDAATTPWRTASERSRDQARRVDRAAITTEAAVSTLATAMAERDDAEALLAAAQQAEAAASGALDRARADAKEALAERRTARLGARVKGLDFPLVALHTYWRASALAPCQIPWWVLAGVGKVETRHGTAFGSEPTPEGDTTKHILGIPLDGRPGTMAIPDTDGGQLDDDPTWDRAVGPMQFIPGTWRRWAADHNADEKADPHNLYDAAGAAAKYLCFRRGNLDTEAAIRGALLSYNRSVPYGTKVLASGHAYRDELNLPDRPDT